MKNKILFCYTLLLLFTSTAAAQAPEKTRTYLSAAFAGTALNTTVNQKGKVVFDLYDYDPASGSVRAFFGVSDGLVGESWLSGEVNNRGEISLEGDLLNFRMEVHGTLTPQGAIDATYRLKGSNPQAGRFQVAFQHELPSALESPIGGRSGTSFFDLVGAWEVGGGLPAQQNPFTGATTGISFVEARRFEIMPDGHFRHIYSHRHCEGGGLSRCCSEQAVLEEGTLDVDAHMLKLDITGGGTINRDSCNKALNREGKVATKIESFPWSLKRDPSGEATLCIQLPSGESTCYKKQP